MAKPQPGVVVRVSSAANKATQGDKDASLSEVCAANQTTLGDNVGSEAHGGQSGLQTAKESSTQNEPPSALSHQHADDVDISGMCQQLLHSLLNGAVDASVYAQVSGRYLSPKEPRARHAWVRGEDTEAEGTLAGRASSTGSDAAGGAQSEDSSASAGGELARGWRLRLDPAGRRQWQSVVDANIIAVEKPTITIEGATALAGNLRSTGDEKAILALTCMCADVYAPHRVLAVACAAQVMAA